MNRLERMLEFLVSRSLPPGVGDTFLDSLPRTGPRKARGSGAGRGHKVASPRAKDGRSGRNAGGRAGAAVGGAAAGGATASAAATAEAGAGNGSGDAGNGHGNGIATTGRTGGRRRRRGRRTPGSGPAASPDGATGTAAAATGSDATKLAAATVAPATPGAAAAAPTSTTGMSATGAATQHQHQQQQAISEAAAAASCVGSETGDGSADGGLLSANTSPTSQGGGGAGGGAGAGAAAAAADAVVPLLHLENLRAALAGSEGFAREVTDALLNADPLLGVVGLDVPALSKTPGQPRRDAVTLDMLRGLSDAPAITLSSGGVPPVQEIVHRMRSSKQNESEAQQLEKLYDTAKQQFLEAHVRHPRFVAGVCSKLTGFLVAVSLFCCVNLWQTKFKRQVSTYRKERRTANETSQQKLRELDEKHTALSQVCVRFCFCVQ